MPMERVGIRAEERTGLIVAVVLHVALLAILSCKACFQRQLSIHRSE